MTAEEYAEKANVEDTIEMYRIFKEAGLVDEPLGRKMHEHMRMALGYSRETDERTIVHSRDEEFLYQHRYTAETLHEAIYGDVLFMSIVLRFCNFGPITIHEWSDSESFTIAVATRFGNELNNEETIIAVLSFCNEEGDHIQLFDEMLDDTLVRQYLMKRCAEIAGFDSYNAHSLKKYLWLCRYTPYVDREGYCISDSVDKPSVPGQILYRADETGMSILGATF